jgi:hypothetical protein
MDLHNAGQLQRRGDCPDAASDTNAWVAVSLFVLDEDVFDWPYGANKTLAFAKDSVKFTLDAHNWHAAQPVCAHCAHRH